MADAESVQLTETGQAGQAAPKTDDKEASPGRGVDRNWMKIAWCEFVGCASLTYFGCGSATTNDSSLTGLGSNILSISFAFGMTVTMCAYAIGPVSGCHINPAVSFGAFVAGRMNLIMMGIYWVAQFLGGMVGAGVLVATLHARVDFASGKKDGVEYLYGANGWGVWCEDGKDCSRTNVTASMYGAGYTIGAAFSTEVITTALFLMVILGSTGKGAHNKFAGLAIGLCLVVIHIFSIAIDGTSVNPARSLGPAIYAGGRALNQVWLFIVAPLIGAGIVGIFYRFKLMELNDEKEE